MTEPGDKPYDPPPTADPVQYDQAPYDPPATAEPETYATAEPASSDTYVPPFAPPEPPVVAELPGAQGLPAGSFETPAAYVPPSTYQYPNVPYSTAGFVQPAQQPSNGLAIGALVLSGLGLCTCLLALPGVIMGHLALTKVSRGEGGGRGAAIAAVVIGYSAMALYIAFTVTAIVLFSKQA